MTEKSREADYFEALYAQSADPWAFETSAYERQKYDATIAALGGRHFDNAIEIGCSIGVLTARLAAFCERLLAVDIAETALDRARLRCRDMPRIIFETRHMPGDWPGGAIVFDLILVSEVLYFLNRADIVSLARQAATSLVPGGLVVLVNFTEAIDEPVSGDEAAEIFIAAGNLTLMMQDRQQKYRIDVLTTSGAGR